MAQTKTISGNDYKNVGGVFINGGTSSNAANTSYSVADLSTLIEIPKVNNGSTFGTTKSLSGGTFSSLERGYYVSSLVTTRIAQTSVDLRSCAGATASRDALHYGKGNRRYHITSWSYTTGAATKGGSAGALFTYVDPADGNTKASETRPTQAIPGELVYMYGSLTPALDDYNARTL